MRSPVSRPVFEGENGALKKMEAIGDRLQGTGYRGPGELVLPVTCHPSPTPMSIEQNLHRVQSRIAEAAALSGRPADAVRLVGVSKGCPAQAVVEAISAGLAEVGENRVQEAAAKIPAIAEAVAQEPRWHLVGHLQTNKARAALHLFDTIQSVDSVRLARSLSLVAEAPVPIFLE